MPLRSTMLNHGGTVTVLSRLMGSIDDVTT